MTSSWNVRSLFNFGNSPETETSQSQGSSNRKLEISGATNKRFYHLYSPLIDDKKSRTREGRVVTHTVRSHGIVVAMTHMHDWLILIVLAVIMVVLQFIHPFYRFVGKDMMSDLKYPLKDNTVPFWAVPVYAVLLPMAVFLVFYFHRRDVYDLHHAILGLLFSVMITGVITNAIKDAVGRPRPDFFWRCFPDGKDIYDRLGNVICHGDSNVVREGHKSFPSGHTSWSFSGLGFLSLYLSGKVRVFDRKGHVAKLCIVFLPLLVASLVGISRVDDYWHHWQDVVAGGLIGVTVATFCYLQFFAPPYHAEGWGPYAFFRALEDLGPSVAQTDVVESSFNNSRLTIDDLESVIR
ncbi:hypothetical protein L1987_47053 [Smallanthus sonchifolius]|uniref:Uncharacterized protein n=1 Tax=Smallanthus sonchifolius TaxID=185202 RepID=A0ACB9G1J4_9ASTR|nr:hypothetical protein L1987_47053 [Smallanthus sonchifolius]